MCLFQNANNLHKNKTRNYCQIEGLTPEVLKYVYINQETKGFFSI